MLKPSEQDIEDVRQSFGRCSLQPGFWDDFYDRFLQSSAVIGEMFKKTDMTKQKQVLRESINFVIMYAKKPDAGMAKNKVDQVGHVHDKGHVNVKPEMYPLWSNTLLATLKAHDPKYNDQLDSQWRAVIKPALDRMISLY